MRSLAALASVVIALSAHAQITPQVTCWRDDAGGAATTIVFGYTNDGAATVVAIGPANYVTPGPDAQSQPETFEAGTVANAFTISIAADQASTASWSVNGSVATFNRALATPCPASMCLCPPGPMGEKGPTGPEGPAGLPGPIGAEGPSGPAGVAGLGGLRGETGASGSMGAAGPAGLQGPVGATGAFGAEGAVGMIGPQGSAGDPGTAGPAGPAGAAGPRGVTGATGPTGDAGPAGADGPQGAAGSRGDPGPSGPAGPTGIRGEPGSAGPTGPRGEPGATGRSGAPGADGVPAILGTVSAGGTVRVTTREAASLVVIASVSARAAHAGGIRLVVDGATRSGPFAVGPRSTLIPIVATVPVDAGEHEVSIASEDAEILSQSLTVLVSRPGEPAPPRRRAAGR